MSKKRTREDYEREVADTERIKKLVGNDKALLEAINKNQDDIVIGIINPSGEDDKKITTYYTKSELKNLVRDFYAKKTKDSGYSIPLYTEHDTNGKEWGKVIFIGLSKTKGTLWMLASINGTPEGNKARREIQSGNMRCLSMGFDVQFREDKKEGVLPVSKTLREVSLCRKGDREGTDIKTICSLRSLLLNQDILNKNFNNQTTTETTKMSVQNGVTMQQLLYGTSGGFSTKEPKNMVDESKIRSIPEGSISFEDMCAQMTSGMESSYGDNDGTFGSSATASATDTPGDVTQQQQQQGDGMETEPKKEDPNTTAAGTTQESGSLSRLKSLLDQNKSEQARILAEIEKAESSLKTSPVNQQQQQQKPAERVTLAVPYKASAQPEPPEEEYIASIQNNSSLTQEQKEKYIKRAYDSYNRDKLIWEKEEQERQKSFDQAAANFAEIIQSLRSSGESNISNEDAAQLAQTLLKDGVTPATNAVLNSMNSFITKSNSSASMVSSEDALIRAHIKKLREEFEGCVKRSSEMEKIFVEERQRLQEESEKLRRSEEEIRQLKSHVPIGTENGFVSNSTASQTRRQVVQPPQNSTKRIVTIPSNKLSFSLEPNASELKKQVYVAAKYAMMRNRAMVQRDGDPRNEIPSVIDELAAKSWADLAESAFLPNDQVYEPLSYPPINEAWKKARLADGRSIT